jgi:hypothetical protein
LGSTAAERSGSYPCDDFVPGADLELFRAIDISAPVPVVFRWLCQMRAAPYSYDLLDTWGGAAGTYAVAPAEDGSRLVLKLVVIPPARRADASFPHRGARPARGFRPKVTAH